MTGQIVFFLHTILVIILALTPQSHGTSDEDRLLSHLMSDYQKYGRPGELDKPVDVTYGLSLLQIKDYCAMSDSVTIEVWSHLNWKDNRLMWSKDAFGGVSSLRLPPSDIWMPDVTTFNAWSEKSMEYNVVVFPNGECTFVPRYVWKLPCRRSGSSAKCTIKLGSWTYDGTQLNLTMNSPDIDTSNFFATDRFGLDAKKSERQVKKYECCPEAYISLLYNFELELHGPLSNSGRSMHSGSTFGSQLLFLSVISIVSIFFAL